MAELEMFSKRVNSLIELSKNNGKNTLLPFLDEAQVGVLLPLLEKYHIPYATDGGIINADRCRYYIGDYECMDFKINTYKIIYNTKYYSINHRNVLGSLMALGIKRECIGDIVIDDKNVYFAITDEISDFIENDFNYVGNIKISIEKVLYPITNVIRYESKDYFLNSLRLDLVISDGFGIPRSDAKDMILDGLCKVNQIEVLKPDHKIEENDEISLRHKGRIKLIEVHGLSKSGKTRVTLGRRI